jgi:hypothetical protein
MKLQEYLDSKSIILTDKLQQSILLVMNDLYVKKYNFKNTYDTVTQITHLQQANTSLEKWNEIYNEALRYHNIYVFS